MKWSKFIWIPIGVAAFAVVLQIADQLAATAIGPKGTKAFAWICYTSWALYFLSGANLRAGGKVLASYGVGITAAIVIMILAGQLGPHVGGFWAAPLAIMIVAPVVLCLERFPPFDFIPGVFVSVAVFFDLMLYVDGMSYGSAALVLGIYGVVGVVLGWASATSRGLYTAWVERRERAGQGKLPVALPRQDGAGSADERQKLVG